MAWFTAYDTLPTHPKTLKLARTLKISRFEAVGVLWCLFSWGLVAAGKNGELPGMTAEDISSAVGWTKKSNLAGALLECGYLDFDGKDFAIHEWYDYAGKLVDKREAERDRMRRTRAAKNP